MSASRSVFSVRTVWRKSRNRREHASGRAASSRAPGTAGSTPEDAVISNVSCLTVLQFVRSANCVLLEYVQCFFKEFPRFILEVVRHSV